MAYEDKTKKPGEESMVYGRNAVSELLKSGRDVDKIFVHKGEREGSISVIVAEAIRRKIPVTEVEKQKLDRICSGNHQGVCAFAAAVEYSTVERILRIAEEKNEKPFICIADGVEDPHNLGALLRCCECAGVHGLIIPKRHSVTVNSTVEKASAGAVSHVPVAKVPNVAACIDELKKLGVWCYAAEAGGRSVYETDLDRAAAFVFGSEGRGVSRLVKEKCDGIVSIPMFGVINSLNVSCAASVVLSYAANSRHRSV